ncbi:expressed unknown protein [Ectocarpus siliculosus]|uniref:Uncharacterized protein n=1 Tax=Ectocarpus siliculosus TaxID=2880 RepID=D8LL20_ECTSI|nr:expressed unknown protein [Ectocarpus siliculosus]|eukprot:CBN76114.1 expressed unknown protein [Ectocarpus siliculosus]
MQLVLRSASLHPPPTTSLDAAASSSSGATASVVASELMAVSAGLHLAMLCRSNTIRAVSLMDVPDAAAHAPSSGSIRTPSSAQQRREDDPFHAVSFSADCAPRPGDDVIPSDSIPPKTPIKGLQFSPSGHSLLIWGESYVAVARLPRSARTTGGSNPTHGVPPATPFLSPPRDLTASGRRRGTAGGDGTSGDKSARWKWTLVDMSGYAVDVMRQRIVHAAWHPASDGCVTLLTAGKDDVYVAVAGVGAKAFVMLHVPGRERPEQVLPIPDGPNVSPPVALAHSHCPGWQRFTIWIAKKDGSVGALCPVVPQTAKVDSEELVGLWSATCDTLVAARWEQAHQSGTDSQQQSALDEEVARLEQQKGWLRETFSHVFYGQDNDGTAAAVPAGGALVARTPRHLVLQDRILAGRTGENAGAACGLAVLQGVGGGAGGDAAEAAAAPPPVVLAVAYREGWVDIALVPAGVSPRWSERAGQRVSCAAAAAGGSGGETSGAVLESLDLAERVEDKTARRRQGLSLSAGGSASWTLLAATPCRVASVTVTWAGRIQRAAERARERAAQDRPGTNSSSGSGRLDGDLRAVLRERPDSQVNEVLFVPRCSSGRIVGVVPVDSPIVGHLAMARLAGGHVEMVNVGVMTLQATEVASAAKRAEAQDTPGRGDMLPRFEAALQKAKKDIGELQANRPLALAAGHLKMSQLDQKGVRVVEEQADRLVDGGVVVLEKLHLKMSRRLETLTEVYEHQSGLVKGTAREIASLRNGQEDKTEWAEEINGMADEQRARSAGVLAVVQATRPNVSPAERAFMSEMKEMENYTDRQQVKIEPAAKQVEELCMAEREAEDFLVREAQGLGTGGRGAGLSERETRDVWNMLQADRERILNLVRRMKTALARLDELGVRKDG